MRASFMMGQSRYGQEEVTVEWHVVGHGTKTRKVVTEPCHAIGEGRDAREEGESLHLAGHTCIKENTKILARDGDL